MNIKRFLVITAVAVFTCIIFSSTASAQVVNGYFIDGTTNWSSGGDGATQWSEFGGEDESPAVRLIMSFTKDVAEDKTRTMTQSVDVTGYEHLVFRMKGGMFEQPENNDGYGKVTIGSSTPVYIGKQGWESYEVDIVGTGIQTLTFELYHWDLESINYNHDAQIWVDHVQLTDRYLFTLSGYVKNTGGTPVRTYLNINDETVESNDTTGYYEFAALPVGSHEITISGGMYESYIDTVNISGNTEKNITMTRLSPVLTYTDSDTTVTDVFLFWKRNLVVDNVRIYKDTETRLLTTVGNGAYLSGTYSDKNLDCNKGYVYWLQPMDGSVAGPKYRIDAKTDPCTDGGGGGTVPDPTPDLTPVVTPGPTVPPEINMTQEEWLNLTLVEKQDVLTNITLMAPVDRLFSPLLEFKWEDVLVWGIHLFLILCAVLALDSITTQKMSEYTGLFAIIPGVVFAYLGGYLVI